MDDKDDENPFKASYTPQTLAEALDAIRNGQKSYKEAASHYNISEATLRFQAQKHGFYESTVKKWSFGAGGHKGEAVQAVVGKKSDGIDGDIPTSMLAPRLVSRQAALSNTDCDVRILSAVKAVRHGVPLEEAAEQYCLKEKFILPRLPKYHLKLPSNLTSFRVIAAAKAVRKHDLSVQEACDKFTVSETALRRRLPNPPVSLALRTAMTAVKKGLPLDQVCKKCKVKESKLRSQLAKDRQRTFPVEESDNLKLRLRTSVKAVRNGMTVSAACAKYGLSAIALRLNVDKPLLDTLHLKSLTKTSNDSQKSFLYQEPNTANPLNGPKLIQDDLEIAKNSTADASSVPLAQEAVHSPQTKFEYVQPTNASNKISEEYLAQINSAIGAVKKEGMSLSEACRQHNVSLNTLRRYMMRASLRLPKSTSPLKIPLNSIKLQASTGSIQDQPKSLDEQDKKLADLQSTIPIYNPKKRGRPLSQEYLRRVELSLKAVKGGFSMGEAAERYKISYMTILRRARHCGIEQHPKVFYTRAQNAVNVITSGDRSIEEASKEYDVPVAVLKHRLSAIEDFDISHGMITDEEMNDSCDNSQIKPESDGHDPVDNCCDGFPLATSDTNLTHGESAGSDLQLTPGSDLQLTPGSDLQLTPEMFRPKSCHRKMYSKDYFQRVELSVKAVAGGLSVYEAGQKYKLSHMTIRRYMKRFDVIPPRRKSCNSTAAAHGESVGSDLQLPPEIFRPKKYRASQSKDYFRRVELSVKAVAGGLPVGKAMQKYKLSDMTIRRYMKRAGVVAPNKKSYASAASTSDTNPAHGESDTNEESDLQLPPEIFQPKKYRQQQSKDYFRRLESSMKAVAGGLPVCKAGKKYKLSDVTIRRYMKRSGVVSVFSKKSYPSASCTSHTYPAQGESDTHPSQGESHTHPAQGESITNPAHGDSALQLPSEIFRPKKYSASQSKDFCQRVESSVKAVARGITVHEAMRKYKLSEMTVRRYMKRAGVVSFGKHFYEQAQKAANAVSSGNMLLEQASKEFGVPETFIQQRMSIIKDLATPNETVPVGNLDKKSRPERKPDSNKPMLGSADMNPHAGKDGEAKQLKIRQRHFSGKLNTHKVLGGKCHYSSRNTKKKKVPTATLR